MSKVSFDISFMVVCWPLNNLETFICWSSCILKIHPREPGNERVKAVLVEKINNFQESEDYVSRVGTTAIGKTNSNLDDENVFVLSEEVRTCRFSLFLEWINWLQLFILCKSRQHGEKTSYYKFSRLSVALYMLSCLGRKVTVFAHSGIAYGLCISFRR